MRNIVGQFTSRDAADKAVDALTEAGVSSDAITVDAPDDGNIVLSAQVENETADAAHAILTQAGATMVEENAPLTADGSVPVEGDVEGEEIARLRDPIAPIVAPVSR